MGASRSAPVVLIVRGISLRQSRDLVHDGTQCLMVEPSGTQCVAGPRRLTRRVDMRDAQRRRRVERVRVRVRHVGRRVLEVHVKRRVGSRPQRDLELHRRVGRDGALQRRHLVTRKCVTKLSSNQMMQKVPFGHFSREVFLQVSPLGF